MEGLTSAEAQKRLLEYGENRLMQKSKKSVVRVFAEQFQDLLVIILIIAAVISGISGNAESTAVILLVIVLNAVLGTLEFIKARDSLSSLQAMSAPKARAIRDHKKIELDAFGIVPGDLLVLEAGDIVAADGTILNNYSLQVNESALTGESVSVDKQIEKDNKVYSGSIVTYGRAEVLVTGTGMQTEIGRIATLMEEGEVPRTPLQISMDAFSRQFAVAILFICVLVFVLGIYRNRSILDALLFAVALAVAAIPEALGSIVTIVQAVGTKRMVKEHAIVKELKAVESLGCVSVICSDKTGTLTQNKMTVQQLYTDHLEESSDVFRAGEKGEQYLILNAVLNNDSVLKKVEKSSYEAVGDPTESCLLCMARKAGMEETVLREKYPRLWELPFDSERKLMSSEYEIDGRKVMFTKGAVDEILCRSSKREGVQGVFQMTEEEKQEILHTNEEFTAEGLRVLAFAYKYIKEGDTPLENALTFLGMVSIMDPPREESKMAVRQAKQAGIRTIMITGDHKSTAAAIAKKIGIMSEEDCVLEGKELDELSEADLEEKLASISVYARVSPENKIRIVRAWQRRNAVVAMTGDGVNDAPALKQADIGISMGITGTEVAKDAAAIILTDDNFATIIRAVANGRNVYKNIRNAIGFLLSGNLAAIAMVLYTSIAGLPIPFAAVQLLFINLATDSLPAIGIGMEPQDDSLLRERPRDPKEALLNRSFLKKILIQGVLIGAATLVSYYKGLEASPKVAGTMAFATLTAARLFHGFNSRGEESILRIGVFRNPYIPLACMVGLLMLAAVLFIPIAQEIFVVVSLSGGQVFFALIAAIAPTLLLQAIAWFKKK